MWYFQSSCNRTPIIQTSADAHRHLLCAKCKSGSTWPTHASQPSTNSSSPRCAELPPSTQGIFARAHSVVSPTHPFPQARDRHPRSSSLAAGPERTTLLRTAPSAPQAQHPHRGRTVARDSAALHFRSPRRRGGRLRRSAEAAARPPAPRPLLDGARHVGTPPCAGPGAACRGGPAPPSTGPHAGRRRLMRGGGGGRPGPTRPAGLPLAPVDAGRRLRGRTPGGSLGEQRVAGVHEAAAAACCGPAAVCEVTSPVAPRGSGEACGAQGGG